MPRSLVLAIALLIATTPSQPAAEPDQDGRILPEGDPIVVELWGATVPGEAGDIGPEGLAPPGNGKRVDRVQNVTRATLSVYKPAKEKDTGAAVMICPGGGYNILAWDLEGTEVAAWLNSLGVTGIVLKYRVPRRKNQPPHAAPLQDAQRGLSVIRSKAKEWGLDPKRIGILGFSAGGHLSAAASTNFTRRSYEPFDDADKESCRPDFTVLIYPAYLEKDLQLNPEITVTAETPPAFLAHAYDDGISPNNSIAYFVALKKHKVSAELHIYPTGGHGYGLRKSEHQVHTWPDRCAAWLQGGGWLKK